MGVVGVGATAAFVLSSGALWFTFLRSWRADPGVITASRQDKFRVRLVTLLPLVYKSIV